MQANQSFINSATSKMKQHINTILSILFPFQELNSKVSVLSEQSWLEKIMTSPQVKDYLWTAK